MRGPAGEGRGGGGAGVIFPFGDLHANAAQERQLFSGCQAVCGFFFRPTEMQVIHTHWWLASTAAANTELLRVCDRLHLHHYRLVVGFSIFFSFHV